MSDPVSRYSLPQAIERGPHTQFLTQLRRALDLVFRVLILRANDSLQKSGEEAMTGPLPLKQYTNSVDPETDLPPAAGNEGSIVYDVTSQEFKGSDGTSWNLLG